MATAEPMATQTLELLEKQLGGQQFFCGADYSMADAILTPMLDYLERVPDSAQWLKKHPSFVIIFFACDCARQGATC